MPNPQYVFKMLIAGNSGVGKTSLVRRYVDNEFIPAKKATIGIDYFLNISIEGLSKEEMVALQIWDLAGEEKYRTFLPSYIPGTQGMFLVFSVDIKDSFEYLYNFMDVLNSLLKTKIPLILIKAKNDLHDDLVSQKDINDFMKKYNIDKYLDTSSKTGQNVNEAFVEITELIAKENNLI